MDDFSRTALLEIDFQPWVAALGHRDTAEVSAVAGRARALARAHAIPIFASRYLAADPSDAHADPDHPDNGWLPGLAPTSGGAELVLTKFGRDLCDNPDLHANLALREIDTVWISGLLTDHGVALTAAGLGRLGYRVVVVEDACAATSRPAHRAALDNLTDQGLRWSALQDLASRS
ncbi:cysteine hydrolase family protein [Dermacoccaceae bacterium W4C1]